MDAVEMYKSGVTVTVIPELADAYKSMGWSEKEPKKAAPVKKKAVKSESET